MTSNLNDPISKDDIYFLVALNASEEASFAELSIELSNHTFVASDLSAVLSDLLLRNELGVMKRSLDACEDLDPKQAHTLVKRIPNSELHEYAIFLTESGFSRWERDHWNISTERAKSLMFKKVKGSVRIDSD